MRIISGKYKGKKIDGYTIDGTRPTMDRVKESMIAMIQNSLNESTCLDLFAGSGSVGLEFLSNGASKCYFVDNNIKVINTLKKNISNFKLDKEVVIIKNDFIEALNGFKNMNIKFDIIFLDPPYQMNYINPTLKFLKENDLINNDGIIICEYENEKIDILDYVVYKEKKYGSKSIMMLKKNI